MEQKCLPREQIVLYPEERDGRHCIRIDYAGSRRIAELLAVDSNVQTDSTGSAHLDAEGFSLRQDIYMGVERKTDYVINYANTAEFAYRFHYPTETKPNEIEVDTYTTGVKDPATLTFTKVDTAE